MPAFLPPTSVPFQSPSLQISLSPRCPLHHPALPLHRRPLATAAATATASPPDPHTSPNSEFRSRFDRLRGKPVEPVATTVARFNKLFMRPVPIVYRAIINELLTTTHLATVCAMWRFDAIFAYGFDSIFADFLKYYPSAEERDLLYKSCAEALGLDKAMIEESAAAVRDWLDAKKEDDIFSALTAASPGADTASVGPVIESLAYIRDASSFEWYYSRLFGIGLIRVMSAVGAELSAAKAEDWADKIGLEKGKFSAEMGSYLSSVERLKQAEQIFAEATAREAKKTAERLAARAEAAAKEAEELEKEGEVAETTQSEPAAKDSSA